MIKCEECKGTGVFTVQVSKKAKTMYTHLCRVCRGHGEYENITPEEISRRLAKNKALREDWNDNVGF